MITTCPSGYKDCDRIGRNGCETDVSGDLMNCGDCGAVCEARDGYLTSCNNGQCEYTDKCVVTTCLVEPNASSTCKLGRCKSICNAGYADCNGVKGQDGCETFVDGDVMNCGACGAVCKERPGYFTSCNRGKCAYLDRCAAIRCAGYPNAVTTCKAGQCKVTCSPGFADCNHNLPKDGCEVAVNTDVFHCGECGSQCPKPVKPGMKPACRYVGILTIFNPIHSLRLNQF